jgi:formylglycine-generating enzyme required for sulfatase activity
MRNYILSIIVCMPFVFSNAQDLQKIEKMLEFVKVEGGTFMMGNTELSDAIVHEVEISSFYMQKTEVTQELWVAVMGENPSKNKSENCPVESISWKEVQAFILKLNSLSGKKYRLPTEAEWEYAARGGNNSKGLKYAGSDDADEVAWNYHNSKIIIHPVAQKKANELGLYDMSGNVSEWCQDWYGNYPQSVLKNPKGAKSGKDRVVRGGSYNGYPTSCNIAERNYWAPGLRGPDLGFRLVYSVK